MPRVKRGVIHLKKRRTLRREAKGFRWGRKKLTKLARVAVYKSGVNAHFDRKKKKSDFRGLWNIRISAAAKNHGLSYSTFMHALKTANIGLDRKVLADLALNNPNVFAAIVNEANKK